MAGELLAQPAGGDALEGAELAEFGTEAGADVPDRDLQIRHRGVFSCVDATMTDATTFKLCRLRYVGSASQWQFAAYRASHGAAVSLRMQTGTLPA